MRIALAQLNPTVGDIAGNLIKHVAAIEEATSRQADLIVFPELSIIGYPPKDLLLKPAAISLCAQAVERIAAAAHGITAIVGFPERNTASAGRSLHNAVAVVRDGRLITKRYKSLLPTYDVFDESRYFEPGAGGGEGGGAQGGGADTELTFIDNHPLGISICEDMWNDEQFVERPLYHFNPIAALAEAGARILLNVSASPFVLGKNAYRRQLFAFQAQRWKLPIIFVNQVGGDDDLVFDGNSAVFDADGRIIAQALDFAEDLLVVDIPPTSALSTPHSALRLPRDGIASIHAALILGLQDYVAKCGFKSVVLGLSGGIDSAVVAALAAEALGPANVTGVSLPSRFSSDHSRSDAALLAQRLGITLLNIPIELPHKAMEQTLAPLFAGTKPGLAEENLQARLRGNLLMALSNKFGHLLLTTGNKSEVATGYCTLYGDMCGGLALISDVPKTMVYDLARHLNAQASAAGKPPPIPEGSLTKPPSAELKPDQTDQDTLPPYDLLDAIIERYIEGEKTAPDIIAQGFAPAIVNRVIRMIDQAEYKRKQMPPGIKVTSRAFGFGRRIPIAQRFDPNQDNLP